jgi:hypothetical protein
MNCSPACAAPQLDGVEQDEGIINKNFVIGISFNGFTLKKKLALARKLRMPDFYVKRLHAMPWPKNDPNGEVGGYMLE